MDANPLYKYTDDYGRILVVWIKKKRTRLAPHTHNLKMQIKEAYIVDNTTCHPLGWVNYRLLVQHKSKPSSAPAP